ncbi:MAG: class IV adenylate cyclase [Candidatus Aminicenantes bacterium]|nr:class IV adenylate cyclase [Candidatus Aminicenantes bacterium]
MTEIEVKIRRDDAAAAREQLLKLGARLEKERARETNTLYDFRGKSLTSQRQALRLRTVGKKCFLTFKGTPQKSRRFKVREEFEVEVRGEKRARKILQALGLIPVFRYEKYRTVFRRDRLKICLDETSLGVFVELEGERSRIIRLVKLWGVSQAELITLDYVELYQQAGREPA